MGKKINILEAVDQLSDLTELDQKPLPARTDIEKSRHLVKETFRTVRNYLQKLHDEEKDTSKDRETGRGIQAIMALAGEAAEKLDKYTALFKGITETGSVRETAEYQDLQHYYLTKIRRRFHEALEEEKAWEAEWAEPSEEAFDLERQGLKDLETIKKDRDYELFYVLNEQGKPFFNRNLIRHLRLVGNIDEQIVDETGERPFLRLHQIAEREIHHTARAILNLVAPQMDLFYRELFKHKNIAWVGAISKALIALMLAANPRNLTEQTTGKAAARYFKDFLAFLREAVTSLQYEKALRGSESDRLHQALLHFTHTLAGLFFTHKPSHKDFDRLIRKWISQGEKGEGEKVMTPLSFWNQLLDQDEQLRQTLKEYPNGPLLKLFETFNQGGEREGFDPLYQGNYPVECYGILFNEKGETSVLHLPSPTRQELITRAEITPEFQAFLRDLKGHNQTNKHLLLNLQDRTSLQESPRCFSLESLPEEGFQDTLTVVTLPRNGEFYYQEESYHDLKAAHEFISQFQHQLENGEDFGFYFSPEMQRALSSFFKPCLEMVHHHFFEGKKLLERDERLNFIEIFHHFLVLKILEVTQPQSMSFTCKDGVDTGAAMRSGFFGFLKILSGTEEWDEKAKEQMTWNLYATSLQIRERAIETRCLHRMASACALLQAIFSRHKAEILKDLSRLFPHIAFPQLDIL